MIMGKTHLESNGLLLISHQNRNTTLLLLCTLKEENKTEVNRLLEYFHSSLNTNNN